MSKMRINLFYSEEELLKMFDLIARLIAKFHYIHCLVRKTRSQNEWKWKQGQSSLKFNKIPIMDYKLNFSDSAEIVFFFKMCS